ncbi:MAG TPA: PQQ-binding-like beta-propeller repeat protein [Roseimicrobium sp.]|nr:PQQ-binding-like beta-propeller repeat protein [Roseimicrobium sp.]
MKRFSRDSSCPGIVALSLLVLNLYCGHASAAGKDWPRFRGPDGDGTAGTGAPVQWSETENVLWKTPLPGPGSSSPIVSGNRIFLTAYSGYGLNPTNAGDVSTLRRHALCYDLNSGRQLWSHSVAPAGPQTLYQGRYITTHGYASSSAVTDGRNVYFFLGDSGVFAYSLDGKPVWQGNVGTASHDWGSGASPILEGDLLIVNGASESDSLVAFHKLTGQVVWTYKGISRAWNTPVVITGADRRRQLLIAPNGRVLGIDVLTGKEIWRAKGIAAAELCPSFVVREGIGYLVGSPKGETMALRLDGRGDVGATNEIWRISKGSNVGSPVLKDGHLFFSNDSRGMVYCVKANTGEVVYEERLPGRGVQLYASPILSGNMLYYVSRAGVTYRVTAEPQFTLAGTNSLAGDDSVFNASPALVSGKLLLRSDKHLYCIGK